jgi:hypothetical protein
MVELSTTWKCAAKWEEHSRKQAEISETVVGSSYVHDRMFLVSKYLGRVAEYMVWKESFTGKKASQGVEFV